MTFKPEEVDTFLELFDGVSGQIRNFPGCHHLQLMKDLDHPNVLVTYSQWQGADDLEKYRQSSLFKGTWTKTKVLFADKPIAFSLEDFLTVA